MSQTHIPPVLVVMWFMGRDSSMLFDMGMRRGTLQSSDGSSRGGWRSAGLSASSVLLGWLRDRGWAATWGSEGGGGRG